MRGTMLAASTGRGKLAFDLGKAARPVGDNIQLRRLALCPVELQARIYGGSQLEHFEDLVRS